MGKGGKVNSRRDLKRRIRSEGKGSDDSDEDYVVSNEENDVSEDELEDSRFYLDENASEESFGGFVEEEEEDDDDEDEVKEVKKHVKSKVRKGDIGNGRSGGKPLRKRKRIVCKEEEDDDYDGEEEYVDNDEDEDEDDDDDEEFTVEEDDCLDEEEELVVRKKSTNNSKKKSNKKLSRKCSRKNRSVRSQERSKSMVSKKSSGKRGRTNRRLRRKFRSDDEEDEDDVDFTDNNIVVREKSKPTSGRRKRKYVVPSDSDFVSSESSDHEYTISEEEREQVREARRLCESLKTNLRSTSLVKKSEEDNSDLTHRRKKTSVRKGKEKISEPKKEVTKQVCGICLTEEDKRRLRGTLNCCSHYFCFTCIMEWSKVESRCPLCKQRFNTITKPERSAAGIDLRSVMIQVPERDQVYQPSEEDLRSYLDPYENVICSECHQGGDDGLMLLCDLCDSSAHTYCVGLGHEVPVGNWYCDGCRPVILGSSTSQAQDPSPETITISNNLNNRQSPIVILGEGLDSFSMPSPRIAPTQGFGNLSSPRVNLGDVAAASPGSGAGASTLTQRRRLHRQIQNIRSSNRLNFMVGSSDGLPTANLSSDVLSPQFNQRREGVVQQTRAHDIRGPLHRSLFDERVPFSPSSYCESREPFASRLSPLRRQTGQDPSTIPMNGSANLMLWPQFAGINSLPPYEQTRQYNNLLNTNSDGCMSAFFMARDDFSAKEQLLSIVKNHLKNLSRDTELENVTCNEIVRSSMHTILAACGLEHKSSEVDIVHNTPSSCSHTESLAAGQTSLMKDVCFSCFDSFVKDVVKRIRDTRLPQWLSLGL